jgi:hypothetical protein
MQLKSFSFSDSEMKKWSCVKMKLKDFIVHSLYARIGDGRILQAHGSWHPRRLVRLNLIENRQDAL